MYLFIYIIYPGARPFTVFKKLRGSRYGKVSPLHLDETYFAGGGAMLFVAALLIFDIFRSLNTDTKILTADDTHTGCCRLKTLFCVQAAVAEKSPLPRNSFISFT